MEHRALATLLISGVQVTYEAWTATLPTKLCIPLLDGSAASGGPSTSEATPLPPPLTGMEVDASIASIEVTDTRVDFDPAIPTVLSVRGDAAHSAGLAVLFSQTPRRFGSGNTTIIGRAMAVDAAMHNLRLSSNNVVMALAGFANPDVRFGVGGQLLSEAEVSAESDIIAESAAAAERAAAVAEKTETSADEVEGKGPVSAMSVRVRMTQPTVVMMGDWQSKQSETLNLAFDLDLAYCVDGFGGSAAKIEAYELRGFRDSVRNTAAPPVSDGDFIQPFTLHLAFSAEEEAAAAAAAAPATGTTLCQQRVKLWSPVTGEFILCTADISCESFSQFDLLPLTSP